MMQIKNAVAIVTGGSTGLGKAIAESLAVEGAQVIIAARDKDRTKTVASALATKGARVEAYVVDVTQPSEIERMATYVIKKYGRIDILVNNAGWATKKSSVEETPADDYERYMRTNVGGVFYGMKFVIPQMKKQGAGLIVNIASTAGKRGHGGLAAYSATKFAVLGLTQAAGWELEKTGISCIAICPAGINTEMRREIFGDEDASRTQSPEAVAKIIIDVIRGNVQVPNGGDISVRQGKIAGVSDPIGGK